MVCFNGAAAFQPRKPPPRTCGVIPAYCSFNGAAAFQPRKLLQGPRPVGQADSFNGAAETPPLPAGTCQQYQASMEPRPFSRGNGQPSFLAAIREGRFNGAAAFQPRKHDETVRRLKQLPMLQWSRGLSAAETTMDLTDRGLGLFFSFNGAAAFQPRKL